MVFKSLKNVGLTRVVGISVLVLVIEICIVIGVGTNGHIKRDFLSETRQFSIPISDGDGRFLQGAHGSADGDAGIGRSERILQGLISFYRILSRSRLLKMRFVLCV